MTRDEFLVQGRKTSALILEPKLLGSSCSHAEGTSSCFYQQLSIMPSSGNLHGKLIFLFSFAGPSLKILWDLTRAMLKLQGLRIPNSEKEMANCFSILVWKIPWTEEPGGPQSMGSQSVRHDWVHTNIHNTPLLLWFRNVFPSPQTMTSKRACSSTGLHSLRPKTLPYIEMQSQFLSLTGLGEWIYQTICTGKVGVVEAWGGKQKSTWQESREQAGEEVLAKGTRSPGREARITDDRSQFP